MTEPIKADAVLHQYMAATINGGPVLDEDPGPGCPGVPKNQ